MVFRILYLYYGAYSCISDLILVLRSIYLSYGTYTYDTELILVFRILYLYYGAYAGITRLIILLQNLYRKYPLVLQRFYLYKSTSRYYRTDTEVLVGTTEQIQRYP